MPGNGQAIQANLFSGNVASPLPDADEGGRQTSASRLDLGSLKTELEEIAGCHVSLKFDRKLKVGVSCRHEDKGFRFLLNPRAFRSKKGTEDHLNFMRQSVGLN